MWSAYRKGGPCLLRALIAVLCCSVVTRTAAFAPPAGRILLSTRSIGVPKRVSAISRTNLIVSLSQEGGDTSSSSGNELSSPLNDPALATLDIVALLGFAAIGKASHAPDGSIDAGAVFVTGFPFITAWLATSPLTGVYSDFEDVGDGTMADVAKGALIQTAKGWALAVPLGCALRGLIKGYVPPVPFVIVTLVATLVILGTVRVLYAVATSD